LSANEFMEGRAVNVSEQGMGLLFNRSFPVGASLTIAMAVPEPNDRSHFRVVTCQVRVAFNVAAGDQFKVGTHFAQMDDASRQLIKHWVHNG
jgi:c-di-GMP-binding flagellar brake protein YcgR